MQQQQHADYDLLAVFGDDSKADAAETKLRKEGFEEAEIYRLASDAASGAQFREHGPNRDRSAVFLQTTRPRPNPVLVVVLALVFGLVLGLVTFAAHFAFAALPEVPTILVGVVVGLILGIIVGLLRRGRVRGAIGQDLTRTTAPPVVKAAGANDRRVLALRFPDPENIGRRSRARAILLSTGGKIDRSVGRRE